MRKKQKNIPRTIGELARSLDIPIWKADVRVREAIRLGTVEKVIVVRDEHPVEAFREIPK